MKPTTRGFWSKDKAEKKFTKAGESLMRLSLQDENVRMVVTKLITDQRQSLSNLGNEKEETAPNKLNIVQTISQSAIKKLNDIDNIYEILPDTETAETIMVSSILAPNDLATSELVWSVDGDFPSELGVLFTDYIRDVLEKDYKISTYLEDIFRKAIYRRGAFIFAILPESSIDEIINSRASLESFLEEEDKGKHFKHLGYLGNTGVKKADKHVSIENYFRESFVPPSAKMTEDQLHDFMGISDNFNILKIPVLQRKVASLHAEKLENASLESFVPAMKMEAPEVKTISQDDIVKSMYRQPTGQHAPMKIVKDAESTSRGTIGPALLLELPFECCIPIHQPGEPDKHIGYFVLLDENRNPLTKESEANNFERLRGQSNQVGVSQVSSLLQQMKFYEKGSCNCTDRTTIHEMEQIYISLVEKDLLARLRNGVYGSNVEIGNAREIYRIMFTRALLHMQTQILFMPLSLVQYIAFEYDKLGMGVSLVGKAKMSAAIRATTNFANNIAMIRNANPRRVATLNIAPKDPDPWGVYEEALSSLAEANSMAFMFHSITPESIENGLSRSSWEIKVQGHPDIPEHSIEVETKSADRQQVDDTTIERIDKRYWTSLKVPASAMEATNEVEFAAVIYQQNALLNKQRTMYAEKGSEHLSELVRKIVLNDGRILRRLTETLLDNMGSLDIVLRELCKESSIPLIKHYLRMLNVKLPETNSERDKNHMEMFAAYKAKVDELVPIYFNRDDISLLIPEGDDEDPNNEIKTKTLDRLEDYVKNVLYRKFIADNNIFPEVYEMFKLDSPEPSVEVVRMFTGENDRLVKALQDVIMIIYNKNKGVAGEGGVAESSNDTSSSDTSSSDTTETTEETGSSDSSTDTTTETENTEETTDTEEKPEEENKEEDTTMDDLLANMPE